MAPFGLQLLENCMEFYPSLNLHREIKRRRRRRRRKKRKRKVVKKFINERMR